MRLRVRVGLLAGAFAFLLISITFGLSWRAQQTHQRWSRLIGVETEAVATLEELIRAQNAFRARVPHDDPQAAQRYRSVEQLLDRPSLRQIDSSVLRVRVTAFRALLEEEQLRDDAGHASVRVINEAQRLIAASEKEISRQLPRLERETRTTMISGLAIVWIIVMISFAVVKMTVQGVVRPIEELALAARRIAAGDVDISPPIAGDREIFDLGIAVNTMAAKLKERAVTDDLTELPNFRAFRTRIEEEIARASRYDLSFGILILDLDRFKQYNDRFGHLAGNDALHRVARAIRDAVRQVDLAARYGGEEFAVIVTQADTGTLVRLGERIRADVEAIPAPPDGDAVTVSIGGATFPNDGATADALFAAADERLYQAKRQGRNRVVVVTTARVVKSAG